MDVLSRLAFLDGIGGDKSVTYVSGTDPLIDLSGRPACAVLRRVKSVCGP